MYFPSQLCAGMEPKESWGFGSRHILPQDPIWLSCLLQVRLHSLIIGCLQGNLETLQRVWANQGKNLLWLHELIDTASVRKRVWHYWALTFSLVHRVKYLISRLWIWSSSPSNCLQSFPAPYSFPDVTDKQQEELPHLVTNRNVFFLKVSLL